MEGWAGRRADKWADGLTQGPNKWADKRADGRTNGRTEGWAGRQEDKRMDGRRDGLSYGVADARLKLSTNLRGNLQEGVCPAISVDIFPLDEQIVDQILVIFEHRDLDTS